MKCDWKFKYITMHVVPRKIFLQLLRNTELTNISEFQENIEEIFPRYS